MFCFSSTIISLPIVFYVKFCSNLTCLNLNNYYSTLFDPAISNNRHLEIAKRNALVLSICLLNRQTKLSILLDFYSIILSLRQHKDFTSFTKYSQTATLQESLLLHPDAVVSEVTKSLAIVRTFYFINYFVKLLRASRRLSCYNMFWGRLFVGEDFKLLTFRKVKSWFNVLNYVLRGDPASVRGKLKLNSKKKIINKRQSALLLSSSLPGFRVFGRVCPATTFNLVKNQEDGISNDRALVNDNNFSFYVKIFISLNNIFITITNKKGQPYVAWSSGSVGFRGPAKQTTAALDRLSAFTLKSLKRLNARNFHLVFTSGPLSSYAKHFLNSLTQPLISVSSVSFFCSIPHNGVRARRQKRR